MTVRAALRLGGVVGAAVVVLAGCGSIPADTEDTLDRARGGTLVVGVSEHPPWTSASPSGAVTGTEAELVEGFAQGIGADVEWHVGPESVLARTIEEGGVDIVIGGLTSSSPWTTHMALTRPYTQAQTEDGKTRDMVMGVPKGENALMVALERHLAEQHGEI
ncbi:transporter substrate-binding domain-containing protein [Dietzia lutea]|uniref:ABC transporter substrate-binding protein n=1 Tax=Dietzia lutea TaxID=546160 RepID=A0A2S1R3U4_9ACTN|nr:transporter substrate-binding domain-containing protein [Dietzia lutea]AWH90966.1 ABC transporter substrate-binding protein [Dietzia lutea]